MLRLLVALAATILGTLATPRISSATEMTTYRIVGTGDSILGMTFGVASPGAVAILTTERWLDFEYGRNVWSYGLARRSSQASIWPLVRARSEPGGVVIFEDNALGVSDSAWATMIQRVVDETPHDRTLVMILPVYHPHWDTQLHATVARRAQVMSSIATQHPHRVVIPWNQAVLADPSMVTDGQHPSARGIIWLNRWIGEAIN